MAGIIALALVGMVTSVIIAEQLKGQAAAINQAGSLRMQSYAITTQLLSGMGYGEMSYGRAVAAAVAEYEARLQHPRLTAVLPARRTHHVRRAYDRIAQEWDGDIKPLMSVYLYNVGSASPAAGGVDLAGLREMLLGRIRGYVGHIDQFVSVLEQEAEAKIAGLRLIQGASLLLTLVLVHLTLWLMYTNVLVPLRELLAFAGRARRGDLSVRVQHASGDELGALGHAFNVMAEDLSKLYGALESRVSEKTADLERSNRYLKLLYDAITRLSEAPVSEATCCLLLKDLERSLGVGPGAICLHEGLGGKPFALASTFHDDEEKALVCRGAGCDLCGRPAAPTAPDAPPARALSVPLKDQDQHYGVLVLQVPAGTELAPWQRQVIEAIGQHIGLAISNLRRANQGRRLALLEERAVIARELHDSLAQSLSYLKIQVSRLQSLLARGADGAAIEPVVDELREGLNGAYRQLRELLTTFRLKMDGQGLAAALAKTIAEFGGRGGVAIALDNRLANFLLSVNEEIHVLQIVREALSNVVRHAHATHAAVRLAQADGDVIVTIDDDGVGIDRRAERAHHYGLAIMHERARALHGTLEVSPRPGGGTRVLFRFPSTVARGAAAPALRAEALP